jgi:DNA-binding NarL/FixJ family response regulator
VRKVHAGGQWVEKQAFGRALDTLLRREAGEREAASVLTPREIEMVGMVARGLRNKEMSQRLSISEGTVKIHLHNIYRKLKVENRVELILYAQAKRLV